VLASTMVSLFPSSSSTMSSTFAANLADACSRTAATTRATVSAIKPYEGFGDVDHTIKELMSL
jgi:hypothetical protein